VHDGDDENTSSMGATAGGSCACPEGLSIDVVYHRSIKIVNYSVIHS